MNGFFSKDFAGPPFELFGTQHIIALLIVLLFNLSMIWWRNRSEKTLKILRYTMAVVLLVNEGMLHLWRIIDGSWSIHNMVPLHLCAVMVYMSAYILFTRDKRLYFLSYFLGIGGAINALLTPDIVEFSFPHFRFFSVFISHGLIVATGVYVAVVEGYRAKFQDVWRSFLYLAIYALPVMLFNVITGANYMFLNRKPDTESILDVMPPWPWYIFILIGVAGVLFSLLYLPFLPGQLREQRAQAGAD